MNAATCERSDEGRYEGCYEGTAQQPRHWRRGWNSLFQFAYFVANLLMQCLGDPFGHDRRVECRCGLAFFERALRAGSVETAASA
ncbi:hypothetical protein SAMN06265784_105360 [Paraburkholderia susongensis]|uniref:Uncharacterized protein n=1 Tax=Paraburkholderia susongensis TaxID=1515439 RepID=A0A1X7LB74_9BURK|nr:hypothetical protein SAMN06265784_105360 [Paraburkholderia susongensis]